MHLELTLLRGKGSLVLHVDRLKEVYRTKDGVTVCVIDIPTKYGELIFLQVKEPLEWIQDQLKSIGVMRAYVVPRM